MIDIFTVIFDINYIQWTSYHIMYSRVGIHLLILMCQYTLLFTISLPDVRWRGQSRLIRNLLSLWMELQNQSEDCRNSLSQRYPVCRVLSLEPNECL